MVVCILVDQWIKKMVKEEGQSKKMMCWVTRRRQVVHFPNKDSDR